jgi:hypothetical protein
MKKLTIGMVIIASLSGALVGFARSRSQPHFTSHRIEFKITSYDEQGREENVSQLTRTRDAEGRWFNHQTLSDGTIRDGSGKPPYPARKVQDAVITDTICGYGVSRSVIDKGTGSAEIYFSPELAEDLKIVLRQANGNLVSVSEATIVDPNNER